MLALRCQLVLSCFIATSVAGQAITIDCMARDQGTQWPMAGGSASGPKHVPPQRALQAMVEGQYDLTLVTTEGVDEPTVARWRVAFFPTDSSLLLPPFTVGIRSRAVLVGTRLDVAHPTPLDSLRKGRFVGGLSDFLMSVDTAAGQLRWQSAPGVMDGGLSFAVAAVDSTGFYGRWIDGGIAVAIMHRGGLTVGEQQRGYYCARKRS
jgi:hypothetical protein